MFTIGDFVVYPVQGVARVIDILEETIGESRRPYYVLESVLETGCERLIIKLPFDRVELNLVRKIISAKEAENVIEALKIRQDNRDRLSWQKRLREYKEKMQSGDILKTAEVLKDLNLMRQEKPLSMSELRIFDQARNLVIKELSIATRRDEGIIEQEILEETTPGIKNRDDSLK